jgi:hypothetical protein
MNYPFISQNTNFTVSPNRVPLKVHKIENVFGFDFEFYTVSLLVMLKYEGFVTNNFWLALRLRGMKIFFNLGQKNLFV